MTPDEKLKLDVRDFWRIQEGLDTYIKLDTKRIMERLRSHKEDCLCEVAACDGKGKLMCTRDGYDAVYALARRHRDAMPVPDDYSVNELADGIKRRYVRALVDEKYDELALARMLAEAVADSEKKHIERTYHFPCVVVPHNKPHQFSIGPVSFTVAQRFR